MCVNNSSAGGVGIRGALAVAEGNTGSSGQVTAVKSNLIYGSSFGQGYLLERVSGTVKDIVTAAGVDYNWRYNSSDGNNLRGCQAVSAGPMWTAGDAVAAGVDVHQGTGNPQFVDASRNVAKWDASLGGAGTYSAGLIRLQANPLLVGSSLIPYVQNGFAPTNPSLRGAAADGTTPGAVDGVFTSSVLNQWWEFEGMSIQFNQADAITKSDTVNFTRGLCQAIYVGGAGDVVAVFQNDSTATFTAVAGEILPLSVKRVNSTSTTATSMVALYQI